MLSVLLSITAGALLGGIVRALVDSYQLHRESRGIARALEAEVRALRQLIETRGIPQQVERMIALLEDSAHVVEPRDIYGLRITNDYFAVFRAVTHKIGFFGDAAADIVVFYSLSKAVVEELVELRDRREQMFDVRVPLEQRNQIDRRELVDRAKELRELLVASVTYSDKLAAQLDAFRARRWMGILR
jgi:hypothetical protein